MKSTPKQFAMALYEALDGKTSAQVKVAIKKFVEFLAGENMISKAEKITAEFVKVWHEKNNIIEAEAISSSGLDKTNIKLLKNYIVGLSGAKEVLLSEKIDKNILGGVVIRYGDKVIDGSLRNSLDELRDKLVK